MRLVQRATGVGSLEVTASVAASGASGEVGPSMCAASSQSRSWGGGGSLVILAEGTVASGTGRTSVVSGTGRALGVSDVDAAIGTGGDVAERGPFAAKLSPATTAAKTESQWHVWVCGFIAGFNMARSNEIVLRVVGGFVVDCSVKGVA